MIAQPGLFETPHFPSPQEGELAELRTRAALLDRNMRALLDKIAVEARPCKACGAMLWFVKHVGGAKAPYTADGTNHFQGCTHPERFSRKAAR